MQYITAETQSSRREIRRNTLRDSAISLRLSGKNDVLHLAENCSISYRSVCFYLFYNPIIFSSNNHHLILFR